MTGPWHGGIPSTQSQVTPHLFTIQARLSFKKSTCFMRALGGFQESREKNKQRNCRTCVAKGKFCENGSFPSPQLGTPLVGMPGDAGFLHGGKINGRGRALSPLHRGASLNLTRKVFWGTPGGHSIPSWPGPNPRMQGSAWPVSLPVGKLISDSRTSESATSAWGISWKAVSKPCSYILCEGCAWPCVGGDCRLTD